MRLSLFVPLALVLLLGACSTDSSPAHENIEAESTGPVYYRSINNPDKCLRPTDYTKGVSLSLGKCDGAATWRREGGYVKHNISWTGRQRCLTAVGNGNGAYLDYCESGNTNQLWAYYNYRQNGRLVGGLDSYPTTMLFSVTEVRQ